MDFRGLLDNGIHRGSNEVGELNLGHRAQSHHGSSQRRGDDVILSQRRVQHAVFAVFFPQPGSGFENAAGRADILAHDENAIVALHFLIERFGNCVNICNRS